MNYSNRRRATNTVNCGRIFSLGALLLIVCVWGLCFVGVKNRIHAMGTQRVGLEKQLRDIQEETRVMDAQVAQLSSHASIEREMQGGAIQLQPIADERIVRLHLNNGRSNMDGLRAVSNKVGLR